MAGCFRKNDSVQRARPQRARWESDRRETTPQTAKKTFTISASMMVNVLVAPETFCRMQSSAWPCESAIAGRPKLAKRRTVTLIWHACRFELGAAHCAVPTSIIVRSSASSSTCMGSTF